MNKLKIENHMKSRSISAITATAYQLLSQNMKLWIKRLWIWAVVTAIASGISYAAAMMIPPEKSPTLILVLWCISAVAALVSLFLTACAVGSVMAVLKEQRTRPNIARALRLAAVIALIFIVAVVLFYAISIPLVIFYQLGALYIHILIAIGIAILTAIFMIPISYSGMKYLAEDDVKLSSVLGKNYLVGLRHFWKLFMTAFVTVLIGMIIAALLVAPLGVMTIASLQDALGVYLGDPTGMPSTLPLLLFTAAAVASIACSLVWLWQLFCIYYQYGSITTRRKEYEEAING